MSRHAALVTTLLAGLALVAGASFAQERPSADDPAPVAGRYRLVHHDGDDLLVFDTATGRLYGHVYAKANVAGRRTVIDPVAGVERGEAVRQPQKERVARAFVQAVLAKDEETVLRLLSEQERKPLVGPERAKFFEALWKDAADLPKDVDQAARYFLHHEAEKVVYSSSEGRWVIR